MQPRQTNITTPGILHQSENLNAKVAANVVQKNLRDSQIGSPRIQLYIYIKFRYF